MDAQQALEWAIALPGWATFVVPGVLPTLGRSTRAIYFLALIAAIVPLTWWNVAFHHGFYAPLVALLTTVAWVFGLAVAFLQRSGMKRGWLWARFPIPSVSAFFVVWIATQFLDWIFVE